PAERPREGRGCGHLRGPCPARPCAGACFPPPPRRQCPASILILVRRPPSSKCDAKSPESAAVLLSEADTHAKLVNPAPYRKGWHEDHIKREGKPRAPLRSSRARHDADPKAVQT